MRRVAVLGHFGFGHDKANGQTIKTKVVTKELQRVFGEKEVSLEDTMGGWRFLLRLPGVCLRLLKSHRNIVFLPAYKGVRIIIPLLVLLNIFFRRKLHYVVIGGWLPKYVGKYPLLRRSLRYVHVIYVETNHMSATLEARGYKNVKVMHNSKPLDIIKEDCLADNTGMPYRLCTFSRVMREKGIQDAIHAVKECNRQLGTATYCLDIYGLIEKGQETWFDDLMSGQPEEIRYRGIIPYNDSTKVLKDYFALLFPTRFKTEGFAGTLIDAMAAGLPVIASDCPSNRELVEEGRTGFLFPFLSVDALTQQLLRIARDPSLIQGMRRYCVARASDYLPEKVIQVLTKEII